MSPLFSFPLFCFCRYRSCWKASSLIVSSIALATVLFLFSVVGDNRVSCSGNLLLFIVVEIVIVRLIVNEIKQWRRCVLSLLYVWLVIMIICEKNLFVLVLVQVRISYKYKYSNREILLLVLIVHTAIRECRSELAETTSQPIYWDVKLEKIILQWIIKIWTKLKIL